jgi:hypothetical protein
MSTSANSQASSISHGWRTPPPLSKEDMLAAAELADNTTPIDAAYQPKPSGEPQPKKRPPRAKRVLSYNPNEGCVRQELEFPDSKRPKRSVSAPVGGLVSILEEEPKRSVSAPVGGLSPVQEEGPKLTSEPSCTVSPLKPDEWAKSGETESFAGFCKKPATQN